MPEVEVDGQLRRGVLEFCVLALLESSPRYGFELVGLLDRSGALLGNQGTIYPLLSRMHRDGRVTTQWRESRSGPPRKYYGLTDEGRKALQRFRAAWSKFSAAVDSVVGKGAGE
jgi:PadR family transcriptional regulator PadR